MSELEIRSFEIREQNEEERSISGLAVPYNQVTSIGDYQERIEMGAFAEIRENVQLFYGHDHRTNGLPIGRVVEARETDEGLFVKAKFSDTPKANEVRTLVKDGVLDRFSIGFMPVESKKDGKVIVRTKGDLREVSIVPMPAYENAAVSEVREDGRSDADTNTNKEDINMSNDSNAPEVVELREQVSDLERKFAGLQTGIKADAKASAFRSGGEFLKALANGDNAAQAEFRAFTGATTADANAGNGSTWVARTLKVVEENRDVLNLWSKSPLPATGNTIEFPVYQGYTGEVALQAAEGDDLAYIEVAVGSATAPVKTYGGYSSLSRQAIERSDVAYLDTVLTVQAQSYAKVTNAAVRSAVAGITGQTVAVEATGDASRNLLRAVLAGRRAIKTGANSTAAFIVMSADVYDDVFTMVDGNGRPLFAINNDGQNTIGSAALSNVGGTIAGLPVFVDDLAAANTAFIAGTDAVTVYEQPGAPVRLADENIINLTKDFSLYGYLAVAVTNPSAIVRITGL